MFDERYELLEVLGTGGTGAVWRARDAILEREVALKILRVGGPDDETMRARLRTEARVAGSLTHPGVGAVYDYGEASDGPYIVMAVVPGEPLSQVLHRERVLGAERVMSIVAQVAAGLEAAHQAGIIHRDLKPGNVMLDEDDRAVLVDFGIARSPDHEPLTVTGTLVGTVDYISPEQIAGGSATTRSDIYSLGMLAYEALSGLKPFRRESQVATALAQLQEEAPALGPEVPESVRLLVERMMAKDPDHRPQSAADVAALAEATLEAPSDLTYAMAVLPPIPRSRPALKDRLRVSQRAMFVLATMTVLAVLAVLALPGFQGPGQTAETTKTQRVIDVVGLPATQAVKRLESAGLVVKLLRMPDASARRGDVLAQVPAAGSRVEPGSVIRLRVAAAPPEPDAQTPPSPTAGATPSATGTAGGGGPAPTGTTSSPKSSTQKTSTPGPGKTSGSGQEKKNKQGGPGKSGAPGKGKKK